MLTINRHISFLSACFSLVAALMLGSCVNENLPCPSDVADEVEGVTISFSLVTRNVAGARNSRTLEMPVNTEQGSSDENYLDLKGLRFLLFDADQTLRRVFVPEVTSDDTQFEKYEVKAFFYGKVEDIFGGASNDTNVKFTIVVIGNYANLSPEGFTYHPGMKLSEIFEKTSVATFAMPGSGWQPLIGSANHIPMSGMQTFTVSKASLQASTFKTPVTLYDNEINMLRSLAKIEIVDRIGAVGIGADVPQPDASLRYSVEKAELIGHTTLGSILPSFNQWNLYNFPETQYVNDTSIPQGATYVGAKPNDQLTITIPNFPRINFFEDKWATAQRIDQCKVFSCYLTEYNPASIASDDEPMWIKITAKAPVESGNPSTPYRLEVAPYNNNRPGDPMRVLRNNIYRYEITGIAGSDLELTVVAADWNEAPEYNIDFTQTPTIKDLLDWDGNEGEIDALGNVIVQPWTETPHPLTGDFFLQGPIGGTWTAALLTLEGAQDAFYFIDAEGKEIGSQVSGNITGVDPQKFRIVSRDPAPVSINRAKLQILVTVGTPPNATVTEVFLGPKNVTYTNFTIVQNPL